MVNFAQTPSSSASQPSMCVSRLVSLTLEKIINENVHRQMNKATPLMMNDPFVKFQSSYEPDVSVEYYIERIFKHSKCSDSCLIIMLIYIDRLIENQLLILSKLNAHRVIITSLMVAAKYHDDLFYNNAYFAKLGGIPLPELNVLEVELLKLLEFSMYVDTSLFEKYQMQLQNYQMYMQYSPSTTAVHPVGSPYSHQHCDNAFQFTPHRFVHEQAQSQQQPQHHLLHPYFVTQQSTSPTMMDSSSCPTFLFPVPANNSSSFSSTDQLHVASTAMSSSLLFDFHDQNHSAATATSMFAPSAIMSHPFYHDQSHHQQQQQHLVPISVDTMYSTSVPTSLPLPIGHHHHSHSHPHPHPNSHAVHHHTVYLTANNGMHTSTTPSTMMIVTPMAPTVDPASNNHNLSSSFPPSSFGALPSYTSPFLPIHHTTSAASCSPPHILPYLAYHHHVALSQQPQSQPQQQPLHYHLHNAHVQHVIPSHLLQPFHSLVAVGF